MRRRYGWLGWTKWKFEPTAGAELEREKMEEISPAIFQKLEKSD